ncbi:MAG: hypothetical protein ACUVWX_00010, partial [Kiritimatiellia bacterium]
SFRKTAPDSSRFKRQLNAGKARQPYLPIAEQYTLLGQRHKQQKIPSHAHHSPHPKRTLTQPPPRGLFGK